MSTSIISSLLFVSTFCLSIIPLLVKANGCGSAGTNGEPLCCEGKDINCATNGYRDNSPYYQPCYCDAACVNTRDCCADYEQVCGAVDCEVSAWSYWSGCSVFCGIGISERRRQIVTQPQNAGRKCPPLRQIKACFSSYCDMEKKWGNSVALILPHYYGDNRASDQNSVSNFIYRDRDEFRSYCVYFKVRNVNKQCYTEGSYRWTDELKKAKLVCVECNKPAYGTEGRCHGEGKRKERTRFAAVDVHGCRGRWIRQSVQENCKCNSGADYIFI